MVSIREDYRARASSFRNDREWKAFVRRRSEWFLIDPEDENEIREYDWIRQNMIRNCYMIRYFAEDLATVDKLRPQTVKMHASNMDDYLCIFAYEETGGDMEKAMRKKAIGSFMNWWFPVSGFRYCEKTVRSRCNSFSRFALWMNRNDLMSDEELKVLKEYFRVWKPIWIKDPGEREFW